MIKNNCDRSIFGGSGCKQVIQMHLSNCPHKTLGSQTSLMGGSNLNFCIYVTFHFVFLSQQENLTFRFKPMTSSYKAPHLQNVKKCTD